ncbi:MAG: M15 family metallopeptidase [Saprospiraceae bacterium]|nr:M15 family metallopeptidase [Saprospiraceae bacterium]
MKKIKKNILALSLLIFSLLILSFSSFRQERDIEIKYLLGKVNPASDTNFVKINRKYTQKENIYLEKNTYAAYFEMYNSAKTDGINLLIVSAFRSFNYQKMLWERKWTGAKSVDGKNLAIEFPNPKERAKEILKYSAMPGTSRHHWGTEVDINSVSNSYFNTKTGIAVYEWLKINASKFGFCQTYSEKNENRPKGFEEEKWHWSYIPVARKYLNAYKEKITYEHLKDYKGCETAKDLNVINDYVLGISSGCE